MMKLITVTTSSRQKLRRLWSVLLRRVMKLAIKLSARKPNSLSTVIWCD